MTLMGMHRLTPCLEQKEMLQLLKGLQTAVGQGEMHMRHKGADWPGAVQLLIHCTVVAAYNWVIWGDGALEPMSLPELA